MGRMIDPADVVAIVGTTFVKHEQVPLLKLGAHTWNRWQLGRLGCPHPVAAASLSRVIDELGITTFAGLAKQAHVIGAFKGLGVTSYYCLLAILREAGYDADKVHADSVTYYTIKRRARNVDARHRRRNRSRRAGPPSESAGASAAAP